MIYIHDVGNVRDGFPPQTNIVRVDGQRASLLNILKTGDASTLDIVKGIRAKLDKSIRPGLPRRQSYIAWRSVDLRSRLD